jgi:hypothetical protein
MKRLEEKYASLQIVNNIEKLGSVKVIYHKFVKCFQHINLCSLAASYDCT